MATFPAPHTVQTGALSPLNVPAGQATQPEPTADSYVPGLHVVGAGVGSEVGVELGSGLGRGVEGATVAAVGEGV